MLDFETYIEDGIHKPYALGMSIDPKIIWPLYKNRVRNKDYHTVLKNGKIVQCFFRNANEDSVEWVANLLQKYVLTVKNNEKTFWAHNGGRFDNVIILKALTFLGYDGKNLNIRRNGGP